MFWLLLGIIITVVQLTIRQKLQSMGKAKVFPNCILVLLANLTIAFGIAWAYSSVIENQMKAAMMGLVLFGGTGLIIAIVAYRIIKKDNTSLTQNEVNEEEKEVEQKVETETE